MIMFNNMLLSDLSEEGKTFVGLRLRSLLQSLPKEDRPNTTIGLCVEFTNSTICINSLTDHNLEDTINHRLNCELYFVVQTGGTVLERYKAEPNHLTVNSFGILEKLLTGYNAYWKGDSMFVKGG